MNINAIAGACFLYARHRIGSTAVRPGKDVVLLLGIAKILIDEGLIDNEFLTMYTNAPNLVGDDGLLLRDKEGAPMVWDSQSDRAKTYTEGVTPTLKGKWTVNGKTYRTAFQVFADSLADIKPEYVAQVSDVPADQVRQLASDLGKQAKIGATVVIDGQRLRYRPVAIHTFRGLSAKEHGVQNWRAGLMVQMLLGNIDAVGGINLHDVYKKPQYFDASPAEYPPSRVDLQESVFFPHATHNIAQGIGEVSTD